MKIVESETGEQFEAVIGRVNEMDLKRVTRSKQFDFDWTVYPDYEVYKLTLKNKDEILGLIAVRGFPEKGFQYTDLKTIELNRTHRGARKKLDNIAGCLIAYGCLLAMNNGCDGYVVIEPKTVLYNHYIQKYGFIRFTGKLLMSDYNNSKELIARYLEIDIQKHKT